MKTKTAVLVRIALCTMLLISPALASGALDIYGNANEDDTIDMRDLTYVKLIFFGKKPETELADAKYDGKINPLDFIQIKLIIVGKEKELTIIDGADRIVTVNKPVERVVLLRPYAVEVIRILGAKDKIVGVSSSVKDDEIYFQELSKLPVVGSARDPDLEAILALNPDLVITLAYPSYVAKIDGKLPGIPIVCLTLYKPEILVENLEKLGYVFGRKDAANEFIDWYEGCINTIKERTEGISEEDRPRVYLEATYSLGEKYKTGGSKTGWNQKIEIAGGNNIFGDISAGIIKVDPEEVIERNPEIIVKRVITKECGYAIDDITGFSDMRKEVMTRPELAHVNAIVNECVYIIHIDIFGGFNHLPGTAYLAKWFHPDLFSDLDPQAIHQEYLTRFQGLDYDLDKHGVFVYPEPS